MQRNHAAGERSTGCEPRGQCVAPVDFEARLAASSPQVCSVFVVPRGDRLETIVLLPTSDDSGRTERFFRWLDPDAGADPEVRPNGRVR